MLVKYVLMKKVIIMSNMSYCRFTNTLADLQDCYEHMDEEHDPEEEDNPISEWENDARQELIALCQTITKQYGEN